MNSEIEDWFDEMDDPQLERLMLEVNHEKEAAPMRRKRQHATRRRLEDLEERRRLGRIYDDLL